MQQIIGNIMNNHTVTQTTPTGQLRAVIGTLPIPWSSGVAATGALLIVETDVFVLAEDTGFVGQVPGQKRWIYTGDALPGQPDPEDVLVIVQDQDGATLRAFSRVRDQGGVLRIFYGA